MQNHTLAQIPEAFRGLFEPHRFKVFYGGRGGGKSRSFARALLLLGTQRPLRVLCAREIQLSIRDSVKRLLDDEVRRLELGAFYQSTDAELRGANGTLFIFAGLRSNPEKIKSYEGLTHCWIEEAETVSDRSLDLIAPHHAHARLGDMDQLQPGPRERPCVASLRGAGPAGRPRPQGGLAR